MAASIKTRGHTAVDVFKLTDGATGGKVSADKFEQLRRGMVHRARRQAISQSLGHSQTGNLAATTPSAPPPAEDLALIDHACKLLPPFAQLMPSERFAVRTCEVSRTPAFYLTFFLRRCTLRCIGCRLHPVTLSWPREQRCSPYSLSLRVPSSVRPASGAPLACAFLRFARLLTAAHSSLNRGEILGELGIVQTTLSNDTWCSGPSGTTLYVIDRRKLHTLLQAGAGSRRIRAAQMLQALPMLEGLTKGQLFALTDVMKRQEVGAGTQISQAFLHAILKGRVQLSDRGALQRCSDTPDAGGEPLSGPWLAGPGDAYGEAACMANGASVAGVNITAVTEAEIMWCDKDTFVRVLGQPEALLVPGAQRKMAHLRQQLGSIVETTASAAPAEHSIAECDETTVLLMEDEPIAASERRVPLPGVGHLSSGTALAPAPAGYAAVPSDEALLAASSSSTGGRSCCRFRTPNQDVSWHGSSMVRVSCPVRANLGSKRSILFRLCMRSNLLRKLRLRRELAIRWLMDPRQQAPLY